MDSDSCNSGGSIYPGILHKYHQDTQNMCNDCHKQTNRIGCCNSKVCNFFRISFRPKGWSKQNSSGCLSYNGTCRCREATRTVRYLRPKHYNHRSAIGGFHREQCHHQEQRYMQTHHQHIRYYLSKRRRKKMNTVVLWRS